MSDDTPKIELEDGQRDAGKVLSDDYPIHADNINDYHRQLVERGGRAMETFKAKRTSMIPAQGTPLHGCPTNLDLTTRVGKALAMRASSPGTLSLDDSGKLRMVCTAFIITPDMSVDVDSGECKEFARVTLFQSDGKHYRTTAAHAPFRLKAMLEIFSPTEWAEGIPLIIEERKSKRGTKYHDINIDIEGSK